jgi:hypothetical protein
LHSHSRPDDKASGLGKSADVGGAA